MRTINIILAIFLLSLTCYSQDKLVRFNSIYSGGIDSFRLDLARELGSSITDPEHDYLIFFEITIGKSNSFSVVELYRKSDIVSNIVVKAIEATHAKWKTTDSGVKIILPVFLINDREDGQKPIREYTYTQQNFPQTEEVIRCIFLAPFVITYFQSH